jgi:Pentapeptide repeats (8 copies)
MSDQANPSPDDVLYIETKYDGTEAAIILVGEFDMTGTERFWGAVSEVVGTCPRSVAVEVRGLTFVDSSGRRALVRAGDAEVIDAVRVLGRFAKRAGRTLEVRYDLAGVNLRGANLRFASLRAADLHAADFTGADLTAADLTKTDLHDADLTAARLGDADLTGGTSEWCRAARHLRHRGDADRLTPDRC